MALTDGLLILRYLFGFRGGSLIVGAVGPGAERDTAPEIEAYLATVLGALDIDGNGSVEPLTDGLLVLRYLFGFRGATLITGAIGAGASATPLPRSRRIWPRCSDRRGRRRTRRFHGLAPWPWQNPAR